MNVNSQFSFNSNTYGAGISQQVSSQQVIATSTSQSTFQVPHNLCLSGLSPDQMSQLMQVISLPKVEASTSQSGPPANQTVTLALINVDPSQHVGGQIMLAPPTLQFQRQSEIHQQPVLLPHCNQIPGMSISNPTTRLQLQPACSIAPALAATNLLESSISLPVSADLRPLAYQLPNNQAPVFNVVSTMSMANKTLPSFTMSSVSSTMPADKFELQMNDLATPGYEFVVSEQPSQTMFEEPASILSNDGMKLNLSHQGIESALSMDPLDYKTQPLFYACDSNEQKQSTTEILPASSQEMAPIQSDMSGFISMPSVTSMFHMPDEQQDIEDSNGFFQPTDLQTDLVTQDKPVAPQAPMPIIGTVASISAPLVHANSLLKMPTKSSKSKRRTNKSASATQEATPILVAPPMADCLNEATSDCSSSDLADTSVDINTKEVAQRVITELKRCGIPQAVFAQQVLCRSQGTLSDLLRNPKPWSKLKSGRETFRRMWKWLQIPAADRISSLRSASLKRKEEACTGLLPHQEQLLEQQQQQQLLQPASPAKPLMQPKCQSPLPPSSASKSVQPSAAPPAAKKPRLVFTDIQRRTLHAIFNETNRPSREMQCTIADQLGLELATVSNFFMNARRRSLEKWQESADCDPNLSAIDESDDERDAIVDEANEAGTGESRDIPVQFARPLPPPPPLLHFGTQAAAATADPALLLTASSASSSSSVSSSPTDAFSVCSTGL